MKKERKLIAERKNIYIYIFTQVFLNVLFCPFISLVDLTSFVLSNKTSTCLLTNYFNIDQELETILEGAKNQVVNVFFFQKKIIFMKIYIRQGKG